MSNYLQSKSSFLFLLVCLSVNLLPSFADPTPEKELYKHTHTTVQQIQADKNKDYWLQATEQEAQLAKTVKGQWVELKYDRMPTLKSAYMPPGLGKKISDMAKGFIYDPDNPGQFFDHLINGYTFLVNIEKQVIPYADKALGDKNPLIISAKAKYIEQLQYLEALKQQRIMLKPSTPQK